MLDWHDNTGSLGLPRLALFSACLSNRLVAKWPLPQHLLLKLCEWQLWSSLTNGGGHGTTSSCPCCQLRLGEALAQLSDLSWTPKRRKQIVTEQHKQPQEDAKTEGEETCTMKITSLPVRTSGVVGTTCYNTLPHPPPTPFCLRKTESIINLRIQKDIEKVSITAEKRSRCWKQEGRLVRFSFNNNCAIFCIGLLDC